MLRTAYYAIAVPVAEGVARLASFHRPKIRAALKGRHEPRGWTGPEECIRLWFHVASLGEFEQAKPVIEALQAGGPAAVWVSFFSPSGLEHAGSYAHAVDLFYLPFRRMALRRAFEIIRPDAVITVRYDLWPGMAWEASRRRVPLLLVNATLPERSPRNRLLLRHLQRSYYGHLSRVLAATAPDARRLRRLCGHGVSVEITGDSRYDRVWARAASSVSLGDLDTILGAASRPILVVGSTYEPEEHALAEALSVMKESSGLSIVVVPHEPTEERLAFAEALFNAAGWAPRRLSAMEPGQPWRMVLLDRVGVLAECYRHADFVMVGGSFKGKVHNVMEPAAWGKPVVVGPHYANSPEGVGMVDCGAVVTVPDAAGLAAVVQGWIRDPAAAVRQGSLARDFLLARLGAAKRIADAIEAEIGRHAPGRVRARHDHASRISTDR
ncbi:hypothetical protein JXA88_16785 [Candidatus Fermentibacteria bacterium]|nr:hypothetical protein [Candidatus Fermentibacteria bacterium]